MRPVLKGSTDQSVVIRIVDSGDGTPETGVVYNTSGIDLWYRREGATKASITEASLSALDDAHSDGGILHIGDGYYRLDLPDAAVASGANGVAVGGTVTGMVVIGCYVPLVNVNPYDGVRMGLTALPNAAADAAGGLIISDAGGLDADAQLVTKINDILTDTGTTLQGEVDGIQADTEDLQSRLPAALTVDGNIKADTLRWGGTLVASANVLIDGAITAAKIASDAIASAKIADGALTAAKFASGAFDAVWAVATRILTAATNITSTGGTTVPQTGDAYARIGAAGASLTDLGGMSTGMKAEVNTEADQALSDYDGPTYTELLNLVRLMVRKDAAIATDLSTLLTAINADLASGAGAFDNSTEALEAMRDRGDAAWATVAATAIRSAVGLASANLDTQIGTAQADLDTLTGADGATLATSQPNYAPNKTTPPTVGAIADQVWEEALGDHTGVSGSTAEALNAAGAAGDPWSTALPGSYSSGQAGKIVGDNIDAAISSRSTYAGGDTSGITTLLSRLSATRAGYLDNLSAGAVALESSLQALITTVGVAGAGLTAADDVVIAAIAALNNLSQANVRTAVGLASANLDTQLAAIAAFIDTEVAAIKAKTDNLPSDPADQSSVEAAILAAWTTALTESYSADGAAPTPAQALFLILQRLTEFSISGTTVSIKKLDGSTEAATLTLDDATSPTSSTRSA